MKNEEMCSWHAAAEERNIDVVKLLEWGAYITMQVTRVLWIEQRGYVAVVHLIIERGGLT